MPGGVSVAYVFVHLLPELNEAQETLAAATGDIFTNIERHVYLVALVGLVVFYGLERLAATSRKQPNASTESDGIVFWVHITSFALYNGLIGYFLLHREEGGLVSLTLFRVAMMLHFIVNDFGLREHHREKYHNKGRWVLAGSVFLGWLLGLFIEVSEVLLATLLAFLGGGITLNVLKEELPEERESRFSAFLIGAVVYAAILLTF